jgi:hypothetical protein
MRKIVKKSKRPPMPDFSSRIFYCARAAVDAVGVAPSVHRRSAHAPATAAVN